MTEQINEVILEALKDPIYSIPKNQQISIDYFPDFISDQLKKYKDFYDVTLRAHINSLPIQPGLKETEVYPRIEKLSNGICDSINSYYEGKLNASSDTFNQTLKGVFYDTLKATILLEPSRAFYRARISHKRVTTRQGLFHIPFENRHLVSTNRYSVPGLPALYLGDSTIVCWEEFNQPNFRELNFSRFVNTRPLNVITLERVEDIVAEAKSNEIDLFLRLLSYITYFPLTLACNICVKETEAVFKPEYIIPQLLLQFIIDDDEIDGIKYPSTKVDYSKLFNVPGYNYVFPVKKISNKGYCQSLSNTFKLTEPTSLEIEELMHNPIQNRHMLGVWKDNEDSLYEEPPQLRLLDSVVKGYRFTAFGYIEEQLRTRPLSEVC